MVDTSSGRSKRISNPSPEAGEYSPEKGQILIPMLRGQKQTTVRIRTKNNSFVYSQDRIDKSGQKLPMMSQTLHSSSRDHSPSQLWEIRRKRQEQIQKYKEYKLQK